MKTKLLTICLLLLTSQVFAGIVDDNIVKLKKTNACVGCKLRFADLSRANLTGANLSGADLANSDLSKANLSGADLTGANLTGADLINLDLSKTNLSGADLTGANLTGANLSGTDLANSDLSSANLRDANLSGANLSGAFILNTYFKGANLNGANLPKKKLQNFPIVGLWKSGYSTGANDGGFVKALIIYQENNLYKYIFLENMIRSPQPFYWIDDQTGEETLHNTEVEDTIHFDKPIFSNEGFSTKEELIQALAGDESNKGYIEEMSFAQGMRIFFCYRCETKEDLERSSEGSNSYFVKDQTIDAIKLSGIIECVRNSKDWRYGEIGVNEYFGEDKKKLPESRQCLGKKINYFIHLSPHADD